jgi:hypothetical protein
MAGNLQNRGYNVLTFGPLKIDYGPKGTTSHFTVTCPTIQPLINYYNYIVSFGASGTLEGADTGSDGVTSAEVKRLEVSIPGLVNGLENYIDELYFDTWELLTNEATESIFSNPLIVGNESGGTGWMNDNDKVVLSYMARNNCTMAEAVSDLNAMVNATPQSLNPPISGGAAGSPDQYQGVSDVRSIQIMLEIQKGQGEYENPTYVLRHTSYCSPTALYDSSIENVECIYTPAQLLTEVGSGWTYNLPPRLYSKIAQIPVRYPPLTEADYYVFGWLKRITREPQLSNFMISVETEYECNLWSNLRYALA